MDTNKFYECGGCGHLHPFGWTGDCRDNQQRFTYEALDNKYGSAWTLVDEITGEES